LQPNPATHRHNGCRVFPAAAIVVRAELDGRRRRQRREHHRKGGGDPAPATTLSGPGGRRAALGKSMAYSPPAAEIGP
jgi:hypothetical protein